MLQLRFGPQEVGFNTPCQMSKFKPTLEGSAGDPFMSSKPHVSKFFPLGFVGLAHEPCLEENDEVPSPIRFQLILKPLAPFTLGKE